MAYKLDSNSTEWIKITYSEYWSLCNKAAKSFIKLGLNLNECVALIGFNSPQWFISLFGAIFAGGIGCGIYTTNSSDACEYILNDSKARICIVENKHQLDKIIKCKNNNTQIDKIIQYSGEIEDDYNGLVINVIFRSCFIKLFIFL